MSSVDEQPTLWPDLFPERSAHIQEIRRDDGRLPFDSQAARNVPLVLASGSSSKIAVLRSLGLRCKVDPADIDETIPSGLDFGDVVRQLSQQKAAHVAIRNPDSIVVGADTMIVLRDEIIGKPLDFSDAIRIVTSLSGRTHEVITGMTIVFPSRADCKVTQLAVTKVTFRQLSDASIRRYVATREPFGKAGAYGLQGVGALLVERVEGEYSNVYGFPISTFVGMLKQNGFELI